MPLLLLLLHNPPSYSFSNAQSLLPSQLVFHHSPRLFHHSLTAGAPSLSNIAMLVNYFGSTAFSSTQFSFHLASSPLSPSSSRFLSNQQPSTSIATAIASSRSANPSLLFITSLILSLLEPFVLQPSFSTFPSKSNTILQPNNHDHAISSTTLISNLSSIFTSQLNLPHNPSMSSIRLSSSSLLQSNSHPFQHSLQMEVLTSLIHYLNFYSNSCVSIFVPIIKSFLLEIRRISVGSVGSLFGHFHRSSSKVSTTDQQSLSSADIHLSLECVCQGLEQLLFGNNNCAKRIQGDYTVNHNKHSPSVDYNKYSPSVD